MIETKKLRLPYLTKFQISDILLNKVLKIPSKYPLFFFIFLCMSNLDDQQPLTVCINYTVIII